MSDFSFFLHGFGKKAIFGEKLCTSIMCKQITFLIIQMNANACERVLQDSGYTVRGAMTFVKIILLIPERWLTISLLA